MYNAVLQSNGHYLTSTGCLLHAKAKGRAYDDPAFPNGQIAARTKIAAFVCPSAPIANESRDPVHNYGGIDYMFVDLSDIDTRVGSATYGQRTLPTGGPDWLTQVVAGMLDCNGGGFARVSDGTSNTLLCIEDASRAHPNVANFGAVSNRNTPVSGPADPMGGNLRRVFAWIDADAATNGFSGPNGVLSPGSRQAKINNHNTPIGGPAECRWSVNNCGPNDEPFAFHTGGANAVMGDGSVRFMSASTEVSILKFMVGAADGTVPVSNE